MTEGRGTPRDGRRDETECLKDTDWGLDGDLSGRPDFVVARMGTVKTSCVTSPRKDRGDQKDFELT